MNRRCFTFLLAAIGIPVGVHAQTADYTPSVARMEEAVNLVKTRGYVPRAVKTSPEAYALDAVGPRHYYNSGSFRRDFMSAVRQENHRTGFSEVGIAENAIAVFMDRLDPWSGYLPPADWRQYQISKTPSYIGVGMDIEQEENGSFTCWPFPFSPASRAGIKPGDHLEAVNDWSTRGSTVYTISSKVRGATGQKVKLSIKGLLMARSVEIFRRPFTTITVTEQPSPVGVLSLRITRFYGSTQSEVAKLIRETYANTVELDLRDCGGGDLSAAVATAGLFLQPGTDVLQVDGRRFTASGQIWNKAVRLRGNKNTASAAEVVIGALLDHGRAEYSGARTRGKGVTQDVIPLRSGGGVILTTGLLFSPSGYSWQGLGFPHAGR
jgi:carboxyl-terminal processing protease